MRDLTWLKTEGHLTSSEKEHGYRVDVWIHEGRIIKNRLDIDEDEIRKLTDNFKYMHAINETDEDNWWDEEYEEDENSDVIQSAPANNNKYMYLLIKY